MSDIEKLARDIAELARDIAEADFIWDFGESGVMAYSPELAGKMFDDAWKDAMSVTRQKFAHIAQVLVAKGYARNGNSA
jgi:hypothetical protein